MEHETQKSHGAPSNANHISYLPGLDGIRALAVLSVLFYHAELAVYGGYLGVESFFVLSGFLITTLLLNEWQRDGRINLKAFWLRRARRLLPALFVLLAATLVLVAVLLPEELAATGREVLAALGYVTNWYLVGTQQSYFDAVQRPPLLQHLWSLAVEEQFYVFWPLLFAGGMRFLRPRGMFTLTIGLAIGSAALMAALFDPGADPSRIYYGTDTRASAMLLGAAMAWLWRPGAQPFASHRGAGIALDILGAAALVALLTLYALLHSQQPLLYRGGFGIASLATAFVIAAATHPMARFIPALLEWKPLRWVGLRSYGIYLWHWPIFMLTRPGVDLPWDGWQIQVLRFAAAFGLAALSYRFVETPVRQGVLDRVWQRVQGQPMLGMPLPSPRWQGQFFRRWVPLMATAVLGLSATGVVTGVSNAANSTVAVAPTAATAPTSQPRAESTAVPTASSSAVSGKTDEVATKAQLTGEPATNPTTQPAEVAPDAEAPSPPQAPEVDPTLVAELQAVLDEAVANGSIPGAVLTVRLPNGATWSGASGLADREAETLMAPDTRVRIGSLSKMFTAVVVLQLVESGQIELDKPIATWLPDLLPQGDKITVRHLLQHTSGLYDYLEDRKFVAQAYRDPNRIWEPRELVAYANDFPTTFEPGEASKWDYSNTNFVVLGMLIEQVTGNTLGQEVHQRILAPLEMAETYVASEEPVQGAQAHGYAKGDDQTDVAMSFAFGTASIVTTSSDLSRFGTALFGGKLLKPETMEQMKQFVNGKGQYNMPKLEYGLGLMSNYLPISVEGADTGRVFGHIGGYGGFRAALWYAPESQVLIALGVNQSSTDPNDLATKVFDTLLAAQGQAK